MSAMPAGWTELSESPRVNALTAQVQAQVPRRADRRAEQKVARRSRQRWAVAGSSIIALSFVCTVAILELLH
jgi:hypothetical protein